MNVKRRAGLDIRYQRNQRRPSVARYAVGQVGMPAQMRRLVRRQRAPAVLEA